MSTLLDTELVRVLSFHGFTLDTQRRGLYKGDARVHLTPKPLEVLIYLVRNRGRVVEKRELLDAVWDGVFVTEDNLVQAIKEIRRALGDSKDDSRFIQTVPRRGYRFVAEVTLQEPTIKFPVPAPDLSLPSSHDSHPLERGRKPTGGFVWLALGIGGLAIVALVGAWVGLSKILWRGERAAKPTPFTNLKVTRITTSGKVKGAAVSADGKYVVYALNNEGQESLWLKQTASASDVQISKPAATQHHALTFSPDANSVYYVIRDQNKLGVLFQIPSFGGVPKKMVSDIDSVIAFSADGKQIAFFRGYPEKGETKLVIANADGSQEKEIASRKRPESFPTLLDSAPAWSPAAPVILCPIITGNADARMTIVAIDTNSGTVTPFTSEHWWQIGNISWLRDGSGLIITAKQQAADPSQLWYLSYSKGGARRITNDLNDYAGVSLTHENPPAIVTLQSSLLSSVAIAPDQNSGLDIPISSVQGGPGLAWTPAGQVVYPARSKGNQDLYLMDADGKNRKQLTADAGDNRWPSVSPDGRYIAFISTRTGVNTIWRISLDGSNPTQLTNGNDARWPRFTADGRRIIYSSIYNPSGLYSVSVDGGESVQLTNTTPSFAAISPDGKLIATGFPAGADKTAIYRSEGGAPQEIMNFATFCMIWKPDAKELTYVDQHGRNILSRPVAGGPTRQITHFTDGQIRGFDWSPDGRLACSRSVAISDAIVIRSMP